MSSKQAERARAKKAQKRKAQVADKRKVAKPDVAKLATTDETVDVGALEPGTRDRLPDGRLKVSAALLQLVSPLRDRFPPGAGTRSVMGLAMVAWNRDVAPTAAPTIDEVAAFDGVTASEEARRGAAVIVETIQDMKRALFPDDRRAIVGLDVLKRDAGPTVQVKSVMLPD
jgi:hypothetical protein